MLYCYYNYKNGLTEYNDAEKIYAKRNKIFCLFDPEEETFKNEYDEKINIKGKIIFPVSGILRSEEFLDKIKENGGIIPSDLDKQDIVINWPDYYKTKRKTLKVKGHQLLDDKFLEYIENLFGEEFFFKTLEKNYSECININYLKNKKSVFYNTILLHKDEDFIISEKVNVLKDDLGKKEYRIYVYNGNIINISRVTISMLHKIDKEIYNKALEIVKKLGMINFPKSYVLDLFEYEKDNKKEIDAIEFNPLISSGRYLYNTVMKLEADDILHDNLYKIAPEKQDLIPLCSHPIYDNHNNLHPSIFFEHKDSFAYDLKQLHDEGVLGLKADLNLNKNVNTKILERLINKNEKKFLEKENINNPILDILNKAKKEMYERKRKELISLTKCPLEYRFLSGTDNYSLSKENEDNLGIPDNGFIYHIVNDYQDKETEFMITDNFIVNELIPILKKNRININYDKMKVRFINYGDTELVYVISDGINTYTMLIGQPITKYGEVKEEYENLIALGNKHIEVIKPILYLNGKEREAYITPYLKQARCIATSYEWGYYIPEPTYRFELFNDKDKSLVNQAIVATLIKLYDEENGLGICDCKLGGGDFILNKKWDNIEHNIHNTLNNLSLISARKMYLTTLKEYINILSHELTKVTYYKNIQDKDKSIIINCKNRCAMNTKDIEEGIELGLKLRKHNIY